MRWLLWCTILPLSLMARSDLEELNHLSTATYPYVLPDLPYSYEALEPTIDTRTMHLHHDYHHQTYLDNLNKALADPELILEQNWQLQEFIKHAFRLSPQVHNNAGGHWNHSFFWLCMTNDTNKQALPDRLKHELEKTFGSIAAFKEKFKQAGLSRLGSGWVWLIRNKNGVLEIVSTLNQDNPMMNGIECFGTPLLTCDLWEHGYYLKYTYSRAGFLDAFWNIVNWQLVDALAHPAN